MKPRKHERAHLIYYLRVFDSGKGDLLGQLTNITSVGMRLIGVKPVAPGLKFQVKMELPHTAGFDGHLTFAAESKWCEKDPAGDYYNIGFTIEKMSGQCLETLNNLIQDYYRENVPEDPLRDMNPPLE